MTTWFTSDPHFGHRLVAKLRGFDDVEEYDAHLVQRFDVVQKQDQVWWLGDMAAASPEPAFRALAQIKGEHHLLTGNHDKCNPMFRDAHRQQRRYLEHFASVQAFARRNVAGVEVLLSHYPYLTHDGQADRGEARHTQYRLPDEGCWLLHGHTHMANQRVHDKQIHVGLDAWAMRPVPLEAIQGIIAAHEAVAPATAIRSTKEAVR